MRDMGAILAKRCKGDESLKTLPTVFIVRSPPLAFDGVTPSTVSDGK